LSTNRVKWASEVLDGDVKPLSQVKISLPLPG
jgi:hypothetical protein